MNDEHSAAPKQPADPPSRAGTDTAATVPQECDRRDAAGHGGSLLRVLIVDDEPIMLQAWRKMLAGQGCEIRTLADGAEVVALIEQWRPDVTLLDIRLPRASGLDLLRQIKQRDLDTEVVMMTAFATVEAAVEAVKQGAYDFLTKPFANIDAAALTVLKAGQHRRLVRRNRTLENLLEVQDSFDGLVGSSTQMRRVFEIIDGVAYSSSTVLIQGESGTGKELVARALHHRSPRQNRPFVAINCSALVDNLLESELFGHERGAFTGAVSTKRGLFEVCDGGSIFLDEVGELPPSTQVKLLRVLQEGELKRVGSNDIRQVNVRVIAATNADLTRAREAGTFREDLFYRLKVITIDVPPLRERTSDIPLLALHFVRKYNARTGKSLRGIDPAAMELLSAFRWPGNVRELENTIERAVVMGRHVEILPDDLPDELRGRHEVRFEQAMVLTELPFRRAREVANVEFEHRYVNQLLCQTDGNVTQAARCAGMDRSNFRRLMRKVGLDPRAYGNGNGGGGRGQP